MKNFGRVRLHASFCLLVSLVSVAACTSVGLGEDEGVSEDELRALTSDEIVGTLAAGETRTIEVAGRPLYRAFRLEVATGEKLDLWVKSPDGDGDPQAWLLGASFQTIARNNDASAQDTSAHIERTISKAGTYYLAIRDEKSRSVTFSVSRGRSTPAQVAQCTTDAQCGGGSSMCFIDHCRTVNESSFFEPLYAAINGVDAAYTPSGELRIAYERSFDGKDHTLFLGPFGAATPDRRSDTSIPFVLDHGPDLEPVIAHSYYDHGGGHISFGSWGGPSRLGEHERVGNFAVGRNATGALFAAIVRQMAPEKSRCNELWFASRPSGGAWSNLEMVDTCTIDRYASLAIHVRKDGTADIIAARSFGEVVRYHRNNPLDPWGQMELSSSNALEDSRPAFTYAHGANGTTHLVSQNTVYTRSHGGEHRGIYIELGDDGPVRTIPLSTHRIPFNLSPRLPFPDLDVDGAGNVWIQKRPIETDRPSVVRIDKAGNVAERSLGLIKTRYSRLAVSPQGEIAIVHGGDMSNVFLRRLTPTN